MANGSFEWLEKPVRVRDESVLDWARQRGVCEVCGKHRPTEPHHVKSKGAGGGDERSNVVSICRTCHDSVHRGLIPRGILHAIIAARQP